jgi:iron(III) transport system permease protein
VVLLVPAFRNMDAALEESGRIVGLGMWGTLRQIVIPIMAPAILVVMILGFIRAIESFEIEQLLGSPFGFYVFATKIYNLVRYEPPEYAPATALSTVFLLVLLAMVYLQRWYVAHRTYRTIGGQGFSNRTVTLGPWLYPVFAIALLIALVVTIVPAALLLMGTFMSVFGHFNLPQTWTLANWERVLADPVLGLSLRNTLVIGVLSAALGIALYALIAYVIVKTRLGGRAFLDFVSWLPWAVPGLLLGMALLWFVFQTRFLIPLYGSIYLLVLTMVVKNMPIGAQLVKSVLVQLGDELEEAGRISGASRLQAFRLVVMPLLMPVFITVGLVSFMTVVRDISSVILLGSAQSRTLALLMFDYATAGQLFEQATVVAVINVLLVVVVALVARVLGGNIGLAR